MPRIYKSKYNDNGEKDPNVPNKKSSEKARPSPEKEKKQRSKSKQRTIFGRMKSST
jgi:hypothetical protein